MQYRESLPLEDHEVVITFDDGPLPPRSTKVLETLAHECVEGDLFHRRRNGAQLPRHGAAHPARHGHTIGTLATATR